MKKLGIIALFFAAFAFVSCGGNNSENNSEAIEHNHDHDHDHDHDVDSSLMLDGAAGSM